VLSDLRDKAHTRSILMNRANNGLSKSTYHLREVNRSTMLYGFCMEEFEPVLGHAALEGSLEDVRRSLNIPEDTDMSLLADLLQKKKFAQAVARDFKAHLFYDSQACHIIQAKSLEYMKLYRGTAGLHESSIRRMETTAWGVAIKVALDTKAKKAQ
jgi:hypothetical protein